MGDQLNSDWIGIGHAFYFHQRRIYLHSPQAPLNFSSLSNAPLQFPKITGHNKTHEYL